jgi:ribonuclease HI
MTNQPLNIYADGGARGNPGPAAIGVVIKDTNNKVLHQFGHPIGQATNNLAEYQAVIAALEYLITNKHKPDSINFFLDSRLVVNQLNGFWKVKDTNLRQKVITIRQLEGTLNLPIKYTAIPREKNSEPDLLLNKTLDEQNHTKS